MALQIPKERPASTVRMLISSVREGEVRYAYALEKLQAAWEAADLPFCDAPDLSVLFVSNLPLATPDQHPALSPAEAEELDRAIRCAQREIDQMSPLLPGEAPSEDVFTYLVQDWEDLRAGTAVAIRTTQRARLFYIFPNAHVDLAGGALTFVEPPPPPPPPLLVVSASLGAELPQSIAVDVAEKLAEQMAKDALKAIAGDLTQLAGGVIAGALAGAIVTAVLDALFPGDKKSPFDAYFKGMQAIVHQELTKETINAISGTLNALRDEITNVYGPARLASDLSLQADRVSLYTHHLNAYDKAFFLGAQGMLGTLQDEDHQRAGFPIFLLGAGLHLMILQETANVDPGNKDPNHDPLRSSYGLPKTGSVARFAKQYADFADKVWPLILAERRKSVTYHVEAVPVFRHFDHFGYFVDAAIDDSKRGRIKFETKNDKNGNRTYLDGHGPDDVKRAMEAYIAARVAEVENSMPQRKGIIAAWRSLVDQPLNVRVGG